MFQIELVGDAHDEAHEAFGSGDVQARAHECLLQRRSQILQQRVDGRKRAHFGNPAGAERGGIGGGRCRIGDGTSRACVPVRPAPSG